MNTIRFITASVALAFLFAAGGQTQEKKPIVMTAVKYEQLKQEILKHRGKVVVVDFWASNCGPCRQHFPLFKKLQEKYGDKGLVVIGVSLDPAVQLPENVADGIESANKFLTKQESPLRNLLLDEPLDVVTKQFEFKSLPFYYFFDRQGKWVRFRAADPGGVPYDKLEELVVKMLAEK